MTALAIPTGKYQMSWPRHRVSVPEQMTELRAGR